MPIETLPLGCPWSDFLPPTIQFCEKNLCSYITAPSNTWSNLGYILVGCYLLLKTIGDRFPISLLLISISAIMTGIASFLYHASFTFFFQFFDLSSMYFFSSLLIALNWKRFSLTDDKKIIFLFVVLVFSSMLILFIFRSIGIFIFAFHIIIALILEFLIFRREKILKINKHSVAEQPLQYKNFLYAMFFFLLGLGIWILDFKKIVCNPNNHILQGHAVWHILTSFCYLFLFRFYSSLKN